jgi:type VII secretion protein EccB
VLTRRDQVQAYRFAQTRVQSALLNGQPDRTDVPMRRQRIAGFVGVMAAVLIAAGFGIYGLLRPGGRQGWRAENTLVVERETGARYIYDPRDQALHPVLNYASARLILNADKVTVRQFSQSSLADAPRGAPRGLPGLPDAFPGPSGMLRGPWLVCSGPAGDAGTGLVVSVGAAPTGQRLDHGHALLVSLPDRRRFLIWNDTRMEVTQPSALPALGLENVTPTPVTTTWVNSILPGPDLGSPPLPGLGTVTRYLVAGAPAKVGQVQKVDADGGVPVRYYVALTDGLAPIPDTTALLLLGNPALRAAYGPGQSVAALTRARADIGAAPLSATRLTPDGFPDTVPQALQQAGNAADGDAQTACAAYADTGGRTTGTTVYVGRQAGATLSGMAAAGSTGPAGASVGQGPRVLLPPGRAAVIRMLPHPGQPSDAMFLVTDAGVKFPIPGRDALRVLGLGSVDPVPVPNGIADLIATGPALDPARANVDVALPTGAASQVTAGSTASGAAVPTGIYVPSSPALPPLTRTTPPTSAPSVRRPPTASSAASSSTTTSRTTPRPPRTTSASPTRSTKAG